MCLQSLVSFCQFVLKILSKNQILTSIKGCNSVANLRKTIIYNTNVDLVNDNVYTKFCLNRSIRFLYIEQKLNSDVNEWRTHQSFHACPRYLQEWRNPIKNEGARVFTKFLPLKVYGDFSRLSRAANSAVLGPIWSNFELVQHVMVVLVTCKNEEDPIKNEGAKVLTTLYIYFSDAQGQITLELVVVSGRNLNSSKLSCMSSLPSRMRMIDSKWRS